MYLSNCFTLNIQKEKTKEKEERREERKKRKKKDFKKKLAVTQLKIRQNIGITELQPFYSF